VLETVNSFWKLVSKDRFTKLKDLVLKCIRCLETHKYVWKSTKGWRKLFQCPRQDPFSAHSHNLWCHAIKHGRTFLQNFLLAVHGKRKQITFSSLILKLLVGHSMSGDPELYIW